MKLEQFKQALERSAQMVRDAENSPFRGWGLYTRSQRLATLFDWIDLGQGSGCKSSTCLHNSHDPYAHNRVAIPKAGVKVIELGYENGFIYALIKDDEVILCRVKHPQHYWSRLEELDANDISEGLRAEIMAKLSQSC